MLKMCWKSKREMHMRFICMINKWNMWNRWRKTFKQEIFELCAY